MNNINKVKLCHFENLCCQRIVIQISFGVYPSLLNIDELISKNIIKPLINGESLQKLKNNFKNTTVNEKLKNLDIELNENLNFY